jgi:MFS family permease
MDAKSSALGVDGDTTLSRQSCLVRVMITSVLSDLAFWMMVPLLALRLAGRGEDPVAIGTFASLPWLVLMLSAPLVPWLVARLGAVATLRLSLALNLIAVLGFALADSYWLLCAVNGVLGMGYGLAWVVTDSWVCGTVEASKRGRLIGVYETVSSGAMGLGPLLIVVIGIAGEMPFLVGGLLIVAGWLATFGVKNDHALTIKPPRLRDVLQSFQMYPAIFLCVFLCGALEDASITFLPVYGMDLGYSATTAALLAGMLGLGSLAIVYPMGVLCDRVGSNAVQLNALLLILVGVVAMLALGEMLLLLLPVVFLWGGLVGSLRATALVEAGGAARGGELVTVITGIMAATTLGSVVGPIVGGAGLSVDSRFGLFWAMLALVIVVGTLILFFRSRGVARDINESPSAFNNPLSNRSPAPKIVLGPE